jgi:hypothetical protein
LVGLNPSTFSSCRVKDFSSDDFTKRSRIPTGSSYKFYSVGKNISQFLISIETTV